MKWRQQQQQQPLPNNNKARKENHTKQSEQTTTIIWNGERKLNRQLSLSATDTATHSRTCDEMVQDSNEIKTDLFQIQQFISLTCFRSTKTFVELLLVFCQCFRSQVSLVFVSFERIAPVFRLRIDFSVQRFVVLCYKSWRVTYRCL